MDLVDFAVSHEQRVTLLHFSHDAADGPDVHTAVVVLTSEQDFGCTLPERNYLMCVGARREGLCARQSEVR